MRNCNGSRSIYSPKARGAIRSSTFSPAGRGMGRGSPLATLIAGSNLSGDLLLNLIYGWPDQCSRGRRRWWNVRSLAYFCLGLTDRGLKLSQAPIPVSRMPCPVADQHCPHQQFFRYIYFYIYSSTVHRHGHVFLTCYGRSMGLMRNVRTGSKISSLIAPDVALQPLAGCCCSTATVHTRLAGCSRQGS